MALAYDSGYFSFSEAGNLKSPPSFWLSHEASLDIVVVAHAMDLAGLAGDDGPGGGSDVAGEEP